MLTRRWTVASAGDGEVVLLAGFKLLFAAMEYAAFVTDFDTGIMSKGNKMIYDQWVTYVVEGDFLNV